MATDLSKEDYETLLDGELAENENFDTEIDLEHTLNPTQEIIDSLNTRHSLHIVADKLRFQRDNNANSVCLNVTFKPRIGNNHENLDGQLTDVVTKHRRNLIDELLVVIDGETKSQTENIVKNYKDKIYEFNAKKAETSRSKFVAAIRKHKSDLEYQRIA